MRLHPLLGMPQNPEKLTCISIVLCDDVFRDERTKKLVIVGTFNFLIAPRVPTLHQKLVVLFTLTNGVGEYMLSLSVEHEETGSVVAGLEGPLKLDDPLAISDINVEMRNVLFPKAGKYWVVLRADEEIIQQRPFVVVTDEAQSAEEKPA